MMQGLCRYGLFIMTQNTPIVKWGNQQTRERGQDGLKAGRGRLGSGWQKARRDGWDWKAEREGKVVRKV
jgi:hypothetical protein